MDNSIIEIQSEYDKLMEEVDKRQEKGKMTYATAKKEITPGLYKDKRGKRYKVQGVVKLLNGEEPVVIYQKLKNDGEELLACTPEYFTESSANGRNGRKRFEKILGADMPFMKERLE